MFLTTVSPSRQLLCLFFIGRVSMEELRQERIAAASYLEQLPSGFRALADLSQVESIDVGCASEIGKFMELFDEKGISLVVRIIPDPKKDIGLNILSLFHYRKRPRIVTCDNFTEAGKALGLDKRVNT